MTRRGRSLMVIWNFRMNRSQRFHALKGKSYVSKETFRREEIKGSLMLRITRTERNSEKQTIYAQYIAPGCQKPSRQSSAFPFRRHNGNNSCVLSTEGPLPLAVHTFQAAFVRNHDFQLDFPLAATLCRNVQLYHIQFHSTRLRRFVCETRA